MFYFNVSYRVLNDIQLQAGLLLGGGFQQSRSTTVLKRKKYSSVPKIDVFRHC